LQTSLCLQFKAHQIAPRAIFLATKFLRAKLPPEQDLMVLDAEVVAGEVEGVGEVAMAATEACRRIQEMTISRNFGSRRHMEKRGLLSVGYGVNVDGSSLMIILKAANGASNMFSVQNVITAITYINELKGLGKNSKQYDEDRRRCKLRVNVESAKELWDSLESKYMVEDASSKKFLLPPSWKDFKHTLKHGKDDLSLVQLGSHLRIEESLRAQDSDKGKGKEVDGPSVNMIEEGKNKNNKQNKGKKCGFKENNNGSSSNKKPNATTHVCKDRCWFKTYEPVEDGSVLYLGDDHFALVHGKGSVVLEFRFGYYNNGMFMLNLNKVPDDSGSVYMSSSTFVNFSLWHARLGHVHYKRMLEMSKDDLIPAIDENPKKCTTCMLTKITRQPFKSITRKSVILELIHSDLFDFHATPSFGNKKYVITFIDDVSHPAKAETRGVTRMDTITTQWHLYKGTKMH
ncbi:zinc finger, CCHC-type containing protein, partial [Tanacetum coccineum]